MSWTKISIIAGAQYSLVLNGGKVKNQAQSVQITLECDTSQSRKVSVIDTKKERHGLTGCKGRSKGTHIDFISKQRHVVELEDSLCMRVSREKKMALSGMMLNTECCIISTKAGEKQPSPPPENGGDRGDNQDQGGGMSGAGIFFTMYVITKWVGSR